MYKVKLTTAELEAIQRGHTPTILQLLQQGDMNVTKELKAPGSDVPFLQGVAHIIDRLTNILTKVV